MSTYTWRGPRRAWATSTAWQRASKVARVGVEIRAAFDLSRLGRGLAARLPTLVINPFGLSRLERRGLPSLPARGGAAAGDTDTVTLPVPESASPSLLPECLTTFERLHAPTTTHPPTPLPPPVAGRRQCSSRARCCSYPRCGTSPRARRPPRGQRLRPTRPPALIRPPPAPNQAQAQGGPQPRPASASLGRPANLFQMAGRTGLALLSTLGGARRSSVRGSGQPCGAVSGAAICAAQ